MANMSYCRFENTMQAMRDCMTALEESCFDLVMLKEELSDTEYNALLKMIKMSEKISNRLTEEEET